MIQNKALRTGLGCIKSTPLSAILSTIRPLQTRRQIIATKLALKLVAGGNSESKELMIELAVMYRQKQMWRNKLHVDCFTARIKTLIHKNFPEYKMGFIWVPGHKGIRRNFRADLFAKVQS